MAAQDEESLKRELGIRSWRNLSKEKFLEFAGNLDKVEKDVALAIVGQFPNFKSLATDALQELTKQFETILGSHDRGAQAAAKGWKRYQTQLQRELDRPNLTNEQRYQFMQDFREAAQALSDDAERRDSFLLKLAGLALGAVVVIAGAAIAVLGGKSQLGPGGRA